MRCSRCGRVNRIAATFCEAPLRSRAPAQLVQRGFRRRQNFVPSVPIQRAPKRRDSVSSPETYTPPHLAEKIPASKAALDGERQRITVLLAALKGSLELLGDRDPEEARDLLEPVVERMMEARLTRSWAMGSWLCLERRSEDHALRGTAPLAGALPRAQGVFRDRLRRSCGAGQSAAIRACGLAGEGRSRDA
jgi:hypothetical protein